MVTFAITNVKWFFVTVITRFSDLFSSSFSVSHLPFLVSYFRQRVGFIDVPVVKKRRE